LPRAVGKTAVRHETSEEAGDMAESERSSGAEGSSRKGGASGKKGGRRTSSSGSGSGRSAAQRSAAAKKGGQARGRQQTASRRVDRGADGAAKPVDISGKDVADFRSVLRRSVITPLNLMMLTRDRVEEVLDDAVKRGRMTNDDAQNVVKSLVTRGRQQTDDVLANLESLLERTRVEVEQRSDDARKLGTDAVDEARRQVGSAASRARKSADPVIASADRARRAAGIGSSFPISGYDDLTAAQIQERLDALSPPELRKVRDYEKRNANRKTVLERIEVKLR
jgi:polyhydroxyalkanoate synthesis regulator phasin